MAFRPPIASRIRWNTINQNAPASGPGHADEPAFRTDREVLGRNGRNGSRFTKIFAASSEQRPFFLIAMEFEKMAGKTTSPTRGDRIFPKMREIEGFLRGKSHSRSIPEGSELSLQKKNQPVNLCQRRLVHLGRLTQSNANSKLKLDYKIKYDFQTRLC